MLEIKLRNSLAKKSYHRNNFKFTNGEIVKEKQAKNSKKKATDKEDYPSEYNLIFNGIVNNEESNGSNTNKEIDELRKVTISISEPKYTYTSSSSVYTPTITIH